MSADSRVPMDAVLRALGVPATVTRPAPDDTPIDTSGVWSTPAIDEVPVGSDLQRKSIRRVMGFSRAVVPTAPRGTRIVAPETKGGATKTWRVEEIVGHDADEIRVLLISELS